MNASKILAASLLSATLAAGFSAPARAAAPVAVSGGVLTGSNGMTLYVFDKDVAGSGKSACTGQCAVNWPPLYAADGDTASGDYGIATRDDGKKQWTFKGKPLYYWVKDSKPGDMSGDGVNNVWHVAKP